MKIDNYERFDTDKDELIWTKIIRINPFDRDNSETTHVVEYFKTEDDEEYYIFKYIMADNNGNIINNFNGYYWREILKQIDFTDNCYIYSQDVTDKKHFGLVTTGKAIKMHIQEDIN